MSSSYLSTSNKIKSTYNYNYQPHNKNELQLIPISSTIISSQNNKLNNNLINKQLHQQLLLTLNPKIHKILKSIKNNFSLITCIGSEQFYLYTRQMLLHVDRQTAVGLTVKLNNNNNNNNNNNRDAYDVNMMDLCKSEVYQYHNDNVNNVNKANRLNQYKNNTKNTKQKQSSLKANSQDMNINNIKHILQHDSYQIQSDYQQQQHDQHQPYYSKHPQKQQIQFKKLNTAFTPQQQSQQLLTLSPNNRNNIKSKRNYIEKNQQTQSQVYKNKIKNNYNCLNDHDDGEQFYKQVEQFKATLESQKKFNLQSQINYHNNKMQNHSQELMYFYNHKEIGTDKHKKPIEWLYAELNTKYNDIINKKQYQNLVYLLSSTILYQINLQHYKSQQDEQNYKHHQFYIKIKQFFEFYKDLQSQITRWNQSSTQDTPDVVLISNIQQNISNKSQIQQQKQVYMKIFKQVQSQYYPQKNINIINKNNNNNSRVNPPYVNITFSPSPINMKLPPTPKRLSISHRQSSLSLQPKKSNFAILHERQHQNQLKNSQFNQNSLLNQKIRLQFRIISSVQQSGNYQSRQKQKTKDILNENYSRMRQITSQGRSIFNEQNIKFIAGNQVKSQCYIRLLEHIVKYYNTINNLQKRHQNQRYNHHEHLSISQFYQTWQSIYSSYIQTNLDHVITSYQQKINQLIIGKSLVSQFKLQQAHQAAKRQCLRQFNQKKLGNSKVYIQSNNFIPDDQNIDEKVEVNWQGRVWEGRV